MSLVLTLLFAVVVAAVPGWAQIPAPSATAKACAYLPIVELEAHFGTKAQNVQGLDQPARFTCAARFPDMLRVATVESHPLTPADQAMTAAQRFAIIKMGIKGLETREFGRIGCFRSSVDVGKPVTSTTCFISQAAYFAFTLQSPDPAQASFEAARVLLEKASAGGTKN